MKQEPLLDVDPQARRAFDYYPTPPWMTRVLMRRLRSSLFDILEPCAGLGAIADVLKKEVPFIRSVETNDLNPETPCDTHHDAARPEYWYGISARQFNKPYCGVTNVPFDLADAIVPLAVRTLPVFATILRLSWLEPTKARAGFLAGNPPRTLLVMPRWDFKGRGATDSVTSAWFIWEKGRSSATRGIEIITRDERDELMAV
jgi:hypothetical protein